MRTKHEKPSSRIPLPPGDIPEGYRCISVYIPDGDAYAQELVGLIGRATSWLVYERDPSHKAVLVAQAWKNALEANPLGVCDGMTVQIRACALDCGVQYSTDGGETWSECISLAGCIEDIVNGVIQDRINDGTLQRPGGPYPPTTPPGVGECHTYHVVLQANGQWISPSEVGVGDTVHITGIAGGWTDGTLAWFCGDGARYLGQACAEDLHYTDAGDPLPTAYHMQAVLHLPDTDVWLDPLALVSMPGGTTAQHFTVQANDASLGDNGGQIEFDVQICSNAGWYHVWDFTNGKQEWEVDPDGETGPVGAWAGDHFVSVAWGPNYESLIINLPAHDDRYLLQARISGHCDAFTGTPPQINYATNGGFVGAWHNLPNGADFAIVFPEQGTAHILHVDASYATAATSGGTMTITKIELWGNGSDPY